MKAMTIIGIVIVGIVGAIAVFASMPSDTWKDHRTDFAGVASSDELNEQVNCLSAGGVWNYASCKFNGKSEHYEIEIIGLKDVYLVDERYDFSYIISGHGYQCGSKEVSFPDQNGDNTKIISSSSCIAGVLMEEFVFDVQKEYGTTFGHVKIKNPGTYAVTVTFDRPNQHLPTITSQKFHVVDLEDPTPSYMGKIVPTLDDFRDTLNESQDIETIFFKFGEPHNDIGSGIHIYIYELNDLTEIWIGYADEILYIQHVDSDGNFLEQLLE